LVTFPLQGFDLNQFVLAKRDGDGVDYTYDLFGVSNHFGGMGGGHYTAYAFSPIKRQWIDYNDSSVRSASSSDIISEAAYLLFYRRRDAKPCDLVQSTK
jgi:ubiquitin carboxyl-terminal hydrolase 4/11/15